MAERVVPLNFDSSLPMSFEEELMSSFLYYDGRSTPKPGGGWDMAVKLCVRSGGLLLLLLLLWL